MGVIHQASRANGTKQSARLVVIEGVVTAGRVMHFDQTTGGIIGAFYLGIGILFFGQHVHRVIAKAGGLSAPVGELAQVAIGIV